ncbi:MAG TPA: glycine dehydrogenase (aminomethyl-transferring) [Bacteroidetes bacterium]|nr:glycine dehydrogenase (aminomethyl-transferring) [Bacteroidota bacterium]HRK05936.1 aminomethyl-transferring glycine dehydrogenase [Chlorobiota bacterium]
MHRDVFEHRHNSLSPHDIDGMLRTVGASTLDQLITETIPSKIRRKNPLNLPPALTEQEMLTELAAIGEQNVVARSYIGMGYYDTFTPPVILRNLIENPGWYTQYTPYQAEIAQGRLESLLNFQTIVTDLTKMEIAGASLLDEATAAAEAMHLMYASRGQQAKDAETLFVDENVFPQTLDVIRTRAEALDIHIVVGRYDEVTFDGSIFGAYIQYPAGDGSVRDYKEFCDAAHAGGALVTVGTDLLALTVLAAPGEFGADVVVGSAQRFGVPLGYGGPHAAFIATKEAYKRVMPGRIIGVSVDAQGNVAYRMALQTREQHIRRDKATSNICTAQALLANVAAMYAVYHGPQGLRGIAERVHTLTSTLASGLRTLGYDLTTSTWFDTITVRADADSVRPRAEARLLNFRYDIPNVIGIALDETTTPADVQDILAVFAEARSVSAPDVTETTIRAAVSPVPEELRRTSDYLTHPVFNSYHTEHELLRYLKRLENKDLSLAHSMIALGSCTMKLNATAEMIPITWPNFNRLHPFAPLNQALGYRKVFDDLEAWLNEITGFDACSLQPNAGAQGEYAGLLAIRGFHRANGNAHRTVALIPSSAHGTNPASAVMAGMKVVVVKATDEGHIDVADLRAKAEQYSNELACLMVTYPSTHGVFEESIIEICDIIHEHGGRVYMDGANMNAQVGLTSPRTIGADVCHLNLHKTFCIPHGGGGPGMGPICVTKELAPWLPGHFVMGQKGHDNVYSSVSAAPWGSASILLISWAYIRMMGGDGLTNATRQAILNANYIKARLEGSYSILYTGSHGRVAHEMIVDLREFKQRGGVEAEDIAKRLMDYGYHAPTLSFPVPGTIMIEPTESESRSELDRFCDALLQIRAEIEDVCSGTIDAKDNPLKHAPHTMYVATADEWTKPYSRATAVFPLPWVRDRKFWPTVGRVDNAYGDRVLVCTCPPMEAYETA